MRKSINLIQSIHTALKMIKSEINVDDVYKQIGYPSINEKKSILDIIFNKKLTLSDTIIQISILKTQYGLTTIDILKDITSYLTKNIDSYNTLNLTKIFDKLGNLETYMSISFNDNIMLANIINIVKNNI